MKETVFYFFGANLIDQLFIIITVIGLAVMLLLPFWLVKNIVLKIAITFLLLVGCFLLALHVFQLPGLVILFIYVLPSLLLAVIIYSFLPEKQLSQANNQDVFTVPFATSKGTQYINIVRGLGIFGAAGSGKTASGFVPIIKHAAERNIGGIVYDYKNFELTGLVQQFYQSSTLPVYTVCPHLPEHTHRVNPIHPSYLTSFFDANTIAAALLDNLLKGQQDNFFTQAAKGALAGVIWKLRNTFKGTTTENKCSLPYACAVLLKKSPEALVDFLTTDQEAAILAKAFLDSADSDRQMAGVMGSISNAVVQLASPEVFYTFSGNDFSLDVNHPNTQSLLCVVNHPKYEKTLSPFIATLLRCALLRMAERDRLPSMLLLDEFPTLRLADVSRIPATMRSYKIATVVGVQDKVQMTETYQEVTMKALIANLSAKILGKVNDPDTARFYEQYFELIDTPQKSVTRQNGMLATTGKASVTTSSREKAKHRAQEFFTLSPGELFFINEKGASKKVKVALEKYTKNAKKFNKDLLLLNPPNTTTNIEEHFQNILDEVRSL